jgi:pyruvate kinase
MYSSKKIATLLQKAENLERQVLAAEVAAQPLLQAAHPSHALSAKNLVHYLSLRTTDITSTQKELSHFAISSLGHSEGYTLNNIQKIKYLLSALAGPGAVGGNWDALDDEAGARILGRNAAALFGSAEYNGHTKIMVTLAGKAANDYAMVHALVKAGMDIARINTAHDDMAAWEKMVANIQKASKAIQKDVKIFIDLAGPKIRTGKVKTVLTPPSDGNGKKPAILLFQGDRLSITKTEGVQETAKHQISLTPVPVFDYLKIGERVYFDDGKLCGAICAIENGEVVVEIIQAPEEGFKLKAEKGVNFPESDVVLPALTAKDIANLDFIAAHADMVGLSFVQTPDDVAALQQQLKQRNKEDIGIILKIETRAAFKNLPSLQLAAMKSPHCGIMIARGDLAVEIGFLRMAEVQEEILWLAEAAHMPVIWATQVLESQVKKGYTTRAEVSDVVKAVRSECVMLNKGKHLEDAIKMVRDIDMRMAVHEDKKRKKLRAMEVARSFFK